MSESFKVAFHDGRGTSGEGEMNFRDLGKWSTLAEREKRKKGWSVEDDSDITIMRQRESGQREPEGHVQKKLRELRMSSDLVGR